MSFPWARFFYPRPAEHDESLQPRRQFGLKELVPGDNPIVDIVAIHGIDGDREGSWTADNGILWLRDLLPEKIPNARILTYGYDANTHGQEQLATEYLQDHATNFISKLALLRQATSTTRRPIIFVAHSSGGILLKSALIHSHLSHNGHLKHHHAISQSTRGVNFFGTPHLGSATVELAQFLLDTGSPASPTSTVLLRQLQRDSDTLQQQLSQYSAISAHFDTKFFYEVYDTKVGTLSRKVVPKSSAVVAGAVNAETIGVNKDHINMVKFPSAEDEDFTTVSTILSLMSKATPDHALDGDQTPIKDNHLSIPNIPRVHTARFEADSRPRCLEGTRVELLQKITDWVEDKENRRIFWLCGQAGTGKTTVSLTVANNCQKKSQLAASFFFSRGDADRNDLGKVFPTLAHQLCIFHSPFKPFLAEVLEQDPDSVFMDPAVQFQKLIVNPLKRCGSFPSPAIVVIDALDECGDENPISKMLSILLANLQEVPRLKFFIASRPEDHIMCGFRQLSADTLSIILHNIEATIVDCDIERYLRDRFSTTSVTYPDQVKSDWPSDGVIKSLVRMSAGLFIFAATAMNFILDPNYRDPFGQLDILLGRSEGNNPSSSTFDFLDQLYLQVLHQACPPTAPPSKRHTLVMLLGAIVLLRDPLSPSALENLLGLQPGDVKRTLCHLHSVIVVPDTDEHHIRLIHPSFFDFATSRCSDPAFLIDSPLCHDRLANACFKQMEVLKRDICNIRDPSILNSEIKDFAVCVKKSLPPSMQYACRYWSYHMCNAGSSNTLELIATFCRTKILYWIEAMSLLDSLRSGIRQIKAVVKFLNELSPPPKVLIFTLKSVAQFIADYFDVISVASLQLYRTGLPLSPTSIYSPFKFEDKGGIRIIRGGEWDSSEVTTLRSSFGEIKSVEFSPDGALIISTSWEAILLWDRAAGTLLKVLKDSESSKHGFVRWARSFRDGNQVISGTTRFALRLWNVATGACLKTIQLKRSNLDTKGKPYYSCSPDFTRIVGTSDNDLLLWKSSDGALLSILHGHSDRVETVAFSPNGLLIASGSDDHTICLWDAIDHTRLRTLRGHSSRVSCVAFSPDSKYIISGSGDNDLHLWDTVNGIASTALKGHSNSINTAAFSPDGAFIISGSDDNTVQVWDVALGKILKTIKCSEWVRNVRISPNGMQYIISVGNIIYLWDSDCVPNLDRSKEEWDFRDVIFSPDGTHIISSNYRENDIHLWDGFTGLRLKILRGHSRVINSLAFSPNSRYFASGSDDTTVHFYDISRSVLRILTGHSDWVHSVAFSPDSNYIVSTSRDKTIRIWGVANGDNLFIFHTSTSTLHSKFSPDGSQIITEDNTYDIPLEFRPHPACSSHNEREQGLIYSSEKEWVFASRGSRKERCMKIPRGWTPLLLDLSGINLSI